MTTEKQEAQPQLGEETVPFEQQNLEESGSVEETQEPEISVTLPLRSIARRRYGIETRMKTISMPLNAEAFRTIASAISA